ncbi:MAG: DNA polymerase I [Candidatus Omnitrophica bacterium]|nr:DNA polymerase I [Candidatus Omnitrophota bacterium]
MEKVRNKPILENSKKKAFLIDGTSFCYRAHYAIKSLTNSSGRPTNAIYGFVTMLNKIITDEAPEFLGVAFDVKAPTFRHKKFKEYKANRPPMPDELSEQIPVIKKVLKAYHIPIFEMPGYEGEDIIATLAKNLKKESIKVYVATGDKDILQLVDDNLKVYNTNKDGLLYDRELIEEKYGVGPEAIIEVMALMGDKVDNVPGIPGIGLKTARKLIQEFSTLEKLLNSAGEIKNERLSRLIKEHSADARLSKELIKIDSDVPIEVDIDKLKMREPDKEKLFMIFKELEFQRLLKEFAPSGGLKKEYKLITKKREFKELIGSLKDTAVFAFDFETTSSNPHEAELAGVSFSWKEGIAYYVPLIGLDKGREGIVRDEALCSLKSIFENEEIKKVGQNVKYESIILTRHKINLKAIHFDTMIASYVLNPSKSNHNLEDISLEYLGHKMISYQDLTGRGKEAVALKEVALDKVCDYACEDSDVTFRLYKILKNKLKEKGLLKLYEEIELPLIEVLAYIEICGVSVDKKKLEAMSGKLKKQLRKLVDDIFCEAGVEFNVNSPKQLQEILFNRLKLPVIKKTKTGASTDAEVLKRLSLDHSLPAMILKYRELSKIKTTYVDSLPSLVNKRTKRIHTSYNQTVTQTGRLSSSGPNLQNIPIRSKLGKEIRAAFMPVSEDFQFLSADYSQIELRVLAHLSGDDNLKRAFRDGLDVHTYTASLVFEAGMEEVTEEMRAVAKTVNFSIIYGISAFGLSRELNIEIAKAKSFIDNYFKRYPGVKAYIDARIKEAEEEGYVTTLFSRRRYIPQIKSGDVTQVNFARRVAINTPVQGTASDLIKIAMINIYNELKKKGFLSRMIMQIHDELIFEIHKDETDKLKKMVKEKMEYVVELDVPIKVDIKVGKSWAEC